MRPFFCYYGGKYRIARRYPPPKHKRIVEPFAGAAGYSVRHYHRDVELYDVNEMICGLWKYLIAVSPQEIRALPLEVEDVRDLKVCQEAKWLIGFWVNKATASPCNVPSSFMKGGTRPKSHWGAEIRDRIARQVKKIRHWKVFNRPYHEAAGRATWFIDPPYQGPAGKYYTHRFDDYPALAEWCRSRDGQVIVCEMEGADWLPFQPFLTANGGNRPGGLHVTEEVIWTNDEGGRVMGGFFSPTQLRVVKEPASVLPACGKCGLLKGCKSPKMQPTGSGRKKIMVIGEAPGRNEDLQGEQFVGETGVFLRRIMRSLGVDLNKDCVKLNSLACRPPDNVIKDERQIDYCRPLVLSAIEYYDPEVIILLGGSAVRSVIAHLWKADPEGIRRWVGFIIPAQKPNCWIAPTYHPSYVMRDKRDRDLYEKVFTGHLKAAIAKAGTRPWDEVPDFASRVECVYSISDAAKLVRYYTALGGEVAFDFETDRLKPDSKKAEIVCCSICWQGKRTIAFPWQGEVIQAMKEMLLAPNVAKIAANCKFEERWVRAKLGISVKNWKWDTMQMAHVLDSRSKISGLKFLAFAMLGQPDYDGHLKSFLGAKEEGGNSPNRVREIDLASLLLYCGTDSLLEWEICQIQKKLLGVR